MKVHATLAIKVTTMIKLTSSGFFLNANHDFSKAPAVARNCGGQSESHVQREILRPRQKETEISGSTGRLLY